MSEQECFRCGKVKPDYSYEQICVRSGIPVLSPICRNCEENRSKVFSKASEVISPAKNRPG